MAAQQSQSTLVIAQRKTPPTDAEKRKQLTQTKMVQRPRPSSEVFGSCSAAGDSPRTEGTNPQIQTHTYQDMTGDYKLGKIKKIPGQPRWLVYRFLGADEYCLLCGKYLGVGHGTTEMHLLRLKNVN